MTPNTLLRLEGTAAFALALIFYFYFGGPWWLFLLLILAPDLAMVGYLIDTRIGSMVYNLVHIYVWPLALIGYGDLMGVPLATQLGLIWGAHIGMDRMIGYGLKYPTAFRDTHLQKV